LSIDAPYREVIQRLDELNRHLVRTYCAKSYLAACEPEYCTYRLLGTCDYLRVVHALAENRGIDIIGRKLL